jgi:hypothetical protein
MPRPLLICDADEVLVQFAAPLEDYLREQGLELRWDSPAIHGNVRERATGEVIAHERITPLIDSFFADRVEACPAVPGAVDALATLARGADIIILSNVPAAQRERRAAALMALGMPYPVMANAGLKGDAVRTLAQDRQHPVAFVDDLPHHHKAVAEAAPQVHRLHLIADVRLRSLIPAARHAHARIDSWDDAAVHLLGVLGLA